METNTWTSYSNLIKDHIEARALIKLSQFKYKFEGKVSAAEEEYFDTLVL